MSDKTEQPTPKRLRESREKGDVCKSQDVPSALTVLALSVYIVVMGGHLPCEKRTTFDCLRSW